MTRVWVLTALVAAGAASLQVTGLSGQAPAEGPKVVELQKLKDNLYLLTGGGGNTAVFVTDLGVVLVDTKLAGWGQPILDKIKSVTNKPVTTIINTHAHGDHTGSNEFFPTSVEIVAQQNTRLNMDRQEAFKGLKVNYLPKLMFKEKMTLGGGKDRDRSLLLRRRPYERRRVGRVPGSPGRPRRRHAGLETAASDRPRQRRQRPRLPRHACEGRRRPQEHRHDHPRSRSADDDEGPRGVRALLPRLP